MLVGSIEISDYLDLVVTHEALQEFTRGLLDVLAGSAASRWRTLEWYNVPEASPALAALKAESERRGWSFALDIYRPTPYIKLTGDFESYLSGLQKKQRHEIRRKMRRLHESGRDVRWYVVEGQDLDQEMDALFALMAEDPKKAEFLSEPMRAQLRSSAHVAQRAGWLWLAFLEIDGQKAAASLNFDYGNRLWGYNSGVSALFLDASPGWVLLGHILQWASENGRSEFDFMRGDEDYKYRFGAVSRHVVHARVIRS
jgi:CelD/BcsL family acetyltransferase involved in cellulose biosynthesis